jgi:hypothetical protein
MSGKLAFGMHGLLHHGLIVAADAKELSAVVLTPLPSHLILFARSKVGQAFQEIERIPVKGSLKERVCLACQLIEEYTALPEF